MSIVIALALLLTFIHYFHPDADAAPVRRHRD
jgi:hypothetical protein